MLEDDSLEWWQKGPYPFDEEARWRAEGCPPIEGTRELKHNQIAELDAWLEKDNAKD